jgi:hypothetical protein
MTNYRDEIARLLKMLRKLDRPPAAPNWVRYIFEDVAKTSRAILRFLKGRPPFDYQPGYRAIKDRIELGIGLDAAVRVATAKGAPAGRIQNKELVEAFFEYDESRKYSAANPIDFEVEYFRVSRDVLVPVAPLSIIREKRKFVPIFACGWAKNPLVLFQRRLLMTVYEDAFLSLTDYQNSPAEVLFFPKDEDSEDNRRSGEIWSRGDYELLSKKELDECLEVFVLAREMARQVLLAEIEQLKKKAEAEEASPPNPAGGDLFPPK